MGNLFKVWIALLSLGILLGLYSVFQIFTIGHGELANATQLLPWGLQVSAYIFLALTSTGCSFVSYLGTLGGVEKIKAIVPRAILLSLLTVVAGFASLSLEIGRLERLPIEFAVNPNLTSAMWWMGVFYSLKMGVLAVELIMLKFHNEKLDRIINWVGLISGIAAVSSLGGVFGVLEGRAYGFGPFTPIYFLIMAFLGGASLILFVSCIINMVKGGDEKLEGAIIMLRKVFIMAMVIVFIASLWRYMVGVWVSDPYYDLFKIGAKQFWLCSVLIGMVVPLIIVALQKKPGILLAAASLITLVIQFIDRNTLIVGIQKIPLLQGVWEPPVLPYTPAPIEIFVVIFVLSIIGIVYSVAEKKGLFESIHH
ncbi:MAG: hypothetical protein A2073_06050 [Deltaproteobacteria bacterium GWC2_42_11]|nr:MAG: hypothetical protein A2073_06050 [Deltaproteobacteria bacterium GWC2_42_11]HBO84172.1 hypothetical protein [Deltaproteobacteria bacterium]